ncbi:MAG: flagellar motor stator protein MotA [bacterium]|nr:flagellar motor stator protein MotA [bacterium]
MKLIGGLIVVFGCVLGGFVLHHGNLMQLFVPTEYLIILGCLVGGMIVKNPGTVMIALVKDILGLIKGGGPGKKEYLEVLKMIYELMQLARKEGVLALESHVNDPGTSSVFSNYPTFTNDHHAVHFLCDTLKLFVAGVLEPHNMDELMERDLDVLHHEEMQTANAMTNAADSLPAIGIVAAVLGIILTMSAIDQGAAAVGMKVAGALVGTFLGVFIAYGMAGPIAGSIEAKIDAKGRYMQCIRHVLAASINGVNPPMAVEIGRRTIFMHDRPTFEELEEALREMKGGG